MKHALTISIIVALLVMAVLYLFTAEVTGLVTGVFQNAAPP